MKVAKIYREQWILNHSLTETNGFDAKNTNWSPQVPITPKSRISLKDVTQPLQEHEVVIPTAASLVKQPIQGKSSQEKSKKAKKRQKKKIGPI